MRRALALFSLVTLFAVAPSRADAQETAVRFPLAEIGDTTFTFQLGEHRWVREGMRGIVVDPRRQDVLVARFRVASVSSSGVARAIVTGQTTSLNALHSVLLEVPSRPWYKQRAFWIGTVLGGVAGFLIGGA
jgi:hypothetical protein